MFSSTTCRFVIFSFLSLSANANSVRGAQRRLDTPTLGTAGGYVILAKTGISTSPISAITGNIGVTGGRALMTGFSFLAPEFKSSMQLSDTSTSFAWTDSLVVATDLNVAYAAMETAYDTIALLTTSGDIVGGQTYNGLNGGKLEGLTLTAGVYTFETNVELSGDMTFSGSATDVFIIQTTKNLVVDAGKKVILSDGAKAENVYWQVAGTVAVGTTATMKGIILCKTNVSFLAGSTLNGRIFSQTAVSLISTTITP
jgi:hypothetical protein